MDAVDPQRPVIRNRASIITTYLEVRVFWKQQLNAALTWLVENDYAFEWEVKGGDSCTLDEYTLIVPSISWANNLTQFAKVLEACDYDHGQNEDEELNHQTFIKQILETSKAIKDGRTRYAVLAKAGEELGELSQEVMISVGDHYKPAGKDGVIGEAIDLMICCSDMIYGVDPEITEEQLIQIAGLKLSKWKEKAELQQPGCVK